VATISRLPIPPLITGPIGKSAPSRIGHTTGITAKASVASDFSTLAGFTVIAKEPTISSGILSGEGVIRHTDQMFSDDFLVTATIGALDTGTTRIVTCGSDNFSSFYGIQINRLPDQIHIIKGSGTTALLDQGIFFSAISRFATVTTSFSVGNTVGVRFDKAASTVRAYRNGAQVSSLPVPRWEIPHGDGFRYWGVAQGVDIFLGVLFTGPRFTSITAADT